MKLRSNFIEVTESVARCASDAYVVFISAERK